ncbi:fibro-slime domain-containing protein [uncultured Bifidobacterium sp.]|uniref:fibro-slime domain-containing protein n=1 Tax=uncultured Bifidobacterium sp. TaxID=165187 RepID=UPI0025841191|nr:fibro-slime domain-containing protein [uncultured Bifidobacterium sp.]
MRGTKHDASQHQRRGIRSRLIASVAAVAMLATSIAAGTAVAADIDETDPTQQNTIVEQPQQGTENAGEQNTEPEVDQTDQPQESDGTEAEAESDNTAEADVTEETTPKTDADKTDTNQSSEKQSAAVPAPQAATQSSRAGQELPELVENVPSTSDSIHVNLYDYTATSSPQNNVNYQCTGKRCTNRPFTFTTKDERGRNNQFSWNAYTGKGGGVSQNIVASNLGEDGYPVLNTDSNVNKSLSYLFNDDTPGVEEKGTDVDGLFRQDSDDYYYFDSRNTFAQFVGNKFNLYEPGRFYEIGEDDHVPAGAGAFMPFNSLKGGDDNTAWYEYEGNDGQNGYRFNESDNYLFGMDLSASFFMPKDGQVNGQDMIFEFEGDDDVWVFIDNVLVLDIGGIHDSYSGSINFSNGNVSVESGDDTTLAKMFKEAGKTWNDSDYAQHTIRFFYFERGEGSSNCKLKFNLPTVPSDVIDVGKAITDSNTDDFSRAEFTMRVDVSDTENGEYVPYDGFYDLYDNNELLAERQKTNRDGTFTLRNGQFARLTGGENGFSATSYYKVYELNADNYDKNDYVFDLSETKMVDDNGDIQTDLIGQSKPIMVGNVNHIIVYNRFNVNGKYTFTVSKRLASGTAPGQQFELRVTNDEGTPYTGEYYLRTDGNLDSVAKQATDGVIKLEAGQDAVIMNVAPGTTFKVEEVNLPSGYLDPTYSCSTNAAQPCDSVTVDNTHAKPSVTVTNTLKRLTASQMLEKSIDGRKWREGDSFTFLVKPFGDSAGLAPAPVNAAEGGSASNGWQVVLRYDQDNCNSDSGSLPTCWTTIDFDVPYPDQGFKYDYEVTEVVPGNTEPGMVYSQAKWILSLQTEESEGVFQLFAVTDSRPQVDDDGNPTTTSSTSPYASDNSLTFVNRVVKVSSLPLTGGNSTARTLLLAGGGVLLVAGAAWLLARRRRV